MCLHAETKAFEYAGEFCRWPVANGLSSDHQAVQEQGEEHLVSGAIGDFLEEQDSMGVQESTDLLEKGWNLARGEVMDQVQ